MITVITGAPGSGKTTALVSLLSELSKDRAVYCSGIPDLLIPHVDLPDPTTWVNDVPDGSIIVIDEVQRVWRPRGPGSKVPLDISALETHRHRGLDFYIITQAPRLIDTNVRALVGRHVHLRELGILGRRWYEWPEISENCQSAWKNAPIKKKYKLDKSIFGQFKSASVHIKPIRSVPWMLAVAVAALIATVFLSYFAYSSISGKLKPPLPITQPSSGTASMSTSALSSNQSQTVAYDTSAFVPRVSNRPESAPLYDHLRKVVNMPVISGCMCIGDKCKCYTDQGTDAGLSSSEAKEWLLNPPFNPYQADIPVVEKKSNVDPA